MTELDYSVLDPLEPLDENKGVDYSVLEPLTPETRAKDKQQKDIAELTARKEALEGRIATVKDTPVPKPTSEMSALGWSNVPRMGGLETSLQKTQSELSEAENRDIFWDTVMFDDFKHDGRTIKALKESLDNVSRNPSPNLEPDKHYHNTERLNKIAKHYENEDEQSQVYRHFTEEELFDEKTRQKRFAELGLDDRAMADQIRGLLGNFEEAGLNIPVDKALATTVVNSVLDNMFKERVLELAKVPFAYDGEGNVQGKTGFGRSVRLNRQILDGEDYVEPTWGNLIKAGFKSVFYPLAGQNQAQAEYDRQLSELAQGKDVRITQYVSVPAGGVGGGMAGVQKVVDPKTWGDKMWLDFARTHNLMDAWEGIPKDASPEDKYAAMQQAAGKELYRKQQNRENAEEIMRITGTHPIRSGFGEAWGSLGWTLQFALGGAVVGQTAMKGAQEQSDRLLTAKFNEDGSVQYEEDSFDRAFTKGLLNASVETASEFTSEVIWDAMFKALFSKLPGTDVLGKNVTKQMVKRSSGRAILRTARQMAAMGKAVHRGGVLSEHMEEVTAGFLNALFNYEMLDSEALATGSTVGGRVREFFTPENQLQTLEQVGYTTLLLGAVGLPIGGAQAAIGEYKANNALRSTLRHLGMDLQASEALLDRDLSTQIQATFNELGRRVKEGEKLDPVISTYLMAYYGASKDVLKNMSARERNDYLAKRLQEKSVIDDNNARALLHETGVKPEVTEKMNSEELQEAVLDVLGTLKNGLGEETLARILEEAGIDPKAIPDNIAGKVKLAREIITSGQFRVLQIETRKFDKAMQLEAQRMADAQAWAIQSEENSKATFEGDLTPLLESPLENPVVSDDNVTIFLDPENNRYVVSNKITGRDDMVFVPFTPDQKADAKALQEAADRQARIADVARETLNRRESIIQTAAGNLLRNGEKVTLVDNTEQAQRYLESKGIDKPVTGRVPGLTLKGENEILLIRDNISSSMLLMETLLHERFHLALDNLGITNEQFAKFVAKATGLNEKEILEDAEKIRKTYSKQGVKLDLNQAIEEAVAHKLETGQLLFEPSLWRYLGDKALGIKSHKISNDLGRVLAGLDNIQSKFNKGWEADSAPLEEQGEAEQETQQPETEQGTEQEKPEATPEAAPETAPQEKISPKERDMLGMLSQVGLTKNDLDRAKLNKDQVAELLNTIEQWLEDGDNAPLDAILERFDLPRPEIQEKGEDAQDATPDAPVEEKTDQEAQSETETEPETVETEQEPAPEKEPEESKPEEKEPEPEPREPSITIKDLAKLGEDAKNGDKEAHKKLVELLGEDNAVILQGDVVDYDTATQEQLKDAEETGKVINDFPLSEVHFDPDRFQFRYIYGEKGASGALEGIKKYDKKQGGTLWLWRDPKDGKAYVVNGHNRGAAAIRLGVTHHNVAFFQAKSDAEARRMGAEMNIREGNGSALDAAKFFRETKMTLEDFEALNIPMRQSMGKRGYALAQLVESLFRKVVSGEIDESVGVAIGENLPDLNAQVQLMEYLKKQRKRDLTIGVVAEIAKIANVAVEKETKEGGAEQIDLFGEEVGRNKLILETAQVRAEIARRLGRDKRLFGMVSKLTNKERLEQEGNLIDAETGKAISQEAGLILNLFHILKETDLVKVIEQAAQEVANGTGISKAVGDIMGEVKTTVLTAIGREVEGVEQTGDDIPSSGGDVQKPSETGTATPREDLTLDALTPEQEKAEQEKIKEQKRKRAEREEIEKRTAAPLKGDSGDLTSTLPSMEGTSDAPLFTENDRIGEQEKGGEKAEPAKTPDKQPEPAEPQKPTARTEFIARGTKVVGKDTDGVAYSGEIEAYNAADDTYTLNVLKVKQPGKAMLPLPIDMKTGNRQVLKKNLPADSVNPIDVDKGPSKLTEAEKRKLRIMDAARDSEIGADIDESISERLERVGGEEVQTPGDKDAAKYGNKSVTDNEIRFKITSPVEERGQLVAVHNLGIKQLEAVVNELGGFAMPSVAVTKPEIGHTEFGEVSVLFGKDTIDPAKSSYNKIYSGDAHTPSFPEVGVKMNEKAVIAVERRLSPLAKGNRMLNGTLHGMEDDIRRAGSPVEAYQYSPEMYALYAADRHGVEITPEMDMNALGSIRSDNPSYEDGYLGWLDETFKGTIVKKGFRNSKDTFAPSGARRSFEATHDPMTLANAVKIMRKKQQSGGQGGFFDTSVIGAARQPFKNIVQVKQAADQLTSIDDAEFNAQKREVTDRWFDLASALDKENGFQGGFGGVTPVDIANAIAKSHDNPIRIRTFLRNLGYNKVSSELANDIAQLARDAAKVPTRYYEAKPARGVGLEEVKAVILPDSAPKSLVDALQKRGTYLEFYKADDKADRIRVLNQVADTVDNVRFKITPEVDAQQRDWAWKYRNGILPIEDKRAAEAIIDRINAARGLPDVVYHGSPTAAGLMKSGGFDVGKRGDLTRAPSARLADFFAGNKGTSAIYAALELSEPMFGPWGTQPQNMNEVLGAVDDMVFGATYSGNRTQGDGSVQSSNPVFWNAYGEYIENVMAAKTAEQRRDLTIDFLNAEDPELRDSMIDAYEEELDRYTENSEQEAAEELYGDDIGDAWREDDDKRDEVYERAREYATNMVDAPKFLTRAPVTEKDLNISQFEWNPDNLPGTEGIERFAIDASKLKRIEYNKEGRNPTGSFAEHLEKAKQEGYEGVAFVDVKDGAGFDTVYALFENATRKSANPFTYDDKGELIPFSERAGDPTKDDIRYKITGDEVAAMWPDYFEDQEQRERLQALRGEREKFYSHENREITGIALDSSKATTEDFLRRVYKMGVETVQNRQADSEVVERSTNTFATEKGKLRALELVEEYASLDGQDLSQFNKRAPSVDERMLMFQLMRQHVFHLENASERFLRSEGAERNAIGQEMRALEGSLDRVITGLRVASTLAGRVLRNHQVGLDSLNMLVYRMARAEREKGAPLNEDEKREIMEKFKAYEREHSRLTEELNQMEKQYQSERMAKEIAERDFAVAKEAIAKLGAFKEIEKDVLGSLDIPVTGIMFKITPEEDAAHLDAVEAGDMEAAQRMVDEAAKKAGYDPSYLHGTQNKFDIQDLREGQGILRRGLYLTQVPEVADNYGTPLRLAVSNRAKVLDLSDGASLLQYMQDNGILDDDDMSDPDLVGYIESGRPFQADPFNRSGYMDQVMDNAETDGYQVVRLLDDLGQDEEGNIATVVLDRSVLKSADAVTYDDAGNVIPLSQRFNAETPDIRFKLPGVKLSEVWAFPEQEISSADTSINNRLLPASFKRIAWRAGTINADIGGGRFDNATEFLASQGVQNVIYDPFNRTPEHNRSAIAKIAGGKAQTATVNNVLNVIREPAARLLVIRQAADAVGPDGTAYFLIYEGAGDGVGRQTSKGWQENRKASDYEAEIRAVFGNVRRKGNMLIATDAGAVAAPRFKLAGVKLDAEYMEAVEKGDMETAQRMVDDAAKRAGYTIGPVYHGTRTDFNIPRTRGMSAFDEKLANVRGDNDAGMFFSNVRDTARDFAQRGRRGDHRLTVEEINNDVWPEGARIVNAYLKLDNPKEFDGVGDFISYRNKNFNRIQDALREEGHNGIVLRNASYDASNPDETWYIATDPSQIKSADPVTYDDAGNVIPLSERFNEQSDDIRYKITPDPMSLEEIQSRVSTGQLTAQEFVAKFAQEALARGYEPEEVKAYLKRVLVERGAKEKPGVKQQQPKQPSDPKKAKVPYNDKDGNPEPKKVAKYAWALSLKEYGDMHGFELEEMSKEHLYGVIDNAVNIANEIMGVEIFDREQLIRLTTGYGKVTEKKRTEFDRALSKTRSMLLSLARINDLAYGNRAKKVETDRLKTVPLMRELAQEVLNMLDRGVATGILPDVDIETVKDVLNSRFDNMRRALKMAIQELAQAIERGTPTTRGEKQEYEDPPDIKELKRIKKELQAVHDAMPAVQERKKARYLENRVTNLKKQISALDEKIEKAKQGVFETVEKKARPTTQEINDLTAERDGKKKELRELEANDLGQQAKRYEEAMKRLQEVGQQLTEALEAGETIPHKDTEPLTEKQLQLEARRRANTELRKQLRDNWALENEDAAERISLTRQLNTLLRQESRLQRLISDKDFQPRVTKDPPVNWQIIKKRNQIAALRSKYEMEARNLEYRMSGFKGKVKAHWETADTVARMWKTWADVSAFVQTGLLAAGHPILASRAFMDATSNAWSERHYIEFWQKIEQDPFYQAFIVNGGKAHQEVDVYQGGNAANVLVQTMKDSQNKVTSVVGQGIDMSQKHFNILVSMMRFYAFKSIVAGQNLDINNKEHAIQLKQIANMVNQLGGAGTMPGKNLKKAFWSSAMMAAQIATATGGAGIIYNATLKGEAGKRHVWYEATPGAWKEALRIHAGLLAANLLMNVFQMMMAKLSGDDDPELGDWEGLQTDSTWDMMWRLYSRTFGPQKVGKTNILINGAYPILRLMHETAKTLTDYDTETSKTRKIGGELARFASGRANPLMSDIVQLLLGRDYMGEPYGPMIFPKLFENKFAKDEKKVTWGDVGQGMVNMTINTLVPLAQRDLIETTVDVAEEFGIFGLMAAPVTMSLAMMGWAKSTYPVSHTRQRFEVEKIMRDYERIKKEGTGDQQAEYRERYGWVVRNEKGFKSHIKRMRDARKSGDEDKIRETGRDFYHYYIGKTERSGVGALW